MKHSEQIKEVKSILTKKEFDSITEIKKTTSSVTNLLGLYFVSEKDRDAAFKRFNTKKYCYVSKHQPRYGIGLGYYRCSNSLF